MKNKLVGRVLLAASLSATLTILPATGVTHLAHSVPSAYAARNIHGITRSMAEQWAWWHFYTSHNGQFNNTPINRKNFFIESVWTKHHRRIQLGIYNRSFNDRVAWYRISTAGNLKLYNQNASAAEGRGVWDIVSRQYQALPDNSAGSFVQANDLKYSRLTAMQKAAAVIIYYSKSEAVPNTPTLVQRGMQQGGFEMSQTEVTYDDVNEPGEGIIYGIRPQNTNVGEDFYSLDDDGTVYFYRSGKKPFKSKSLQSIIEYINIHNKQDEVNKIAGMIQVSPKHPMRK
ncbi:MAG: hypothetical protein ACI4UB_02365 [Limosilactobacillus sp.]